jgi:homoserine kinase type II
VAGQAFDEILAGYPARFQPDSPLESLGGAGGLSGARLWRYHSASGPMVLRAWPQDGPGREHLDRVHDWLSKTSVLGFTPVPVSDEAGQSLHEYEDRFWEITPLLPGTAYAASPPSPGRLQAAFAGLAALHRLLGDEQIEASSPGLKRRYETVLQLVGGGIDHLEVAVQRQNPAHSGDLKPENRWLILARTVAPRLLHSLWKAATLVTRLQPCLRDARAEHFLFDGERLTGLVDFGAMGVDSVAGDLARLIGEWLDGDTQLRGQALAAYEQISPLKPAELVLIGVFESSADLLIGERWIRWHYIENRRFEDPGAVSSGLARGVKRLERLACELARP